MKKDNEIELEEWFRFRLEFNIPDSLETLHTLEKCIAFIKEIQSCNGKNIKVISDFYTCQKPIETTHE